MLTPYDEQWPVLAARRVADLRRVLAPVDPGCTIDHIGSTSVPGLVAKPLIDPQVRMSHLPDAATLDRVLVEVGFLPHHGSRPDSPGVHRDNPRGSLRVPDHVWVKRLFTAQEPDTVGTCAATTPPEVTTP